MPPKTSRRHTNGTAARQRIVDAALEMSATHSHVGMTMGMVRRRTGLPASSIYWHFKSKDDLLAAAVEAGHRLYLEALAARPADDGQARLARLIDARMAAPRFWRLGFLLALTSGDEGQAARVRFAQLRAEVVRTQHLMHWQQVLADDTTTGPAATATQVELALLDGLFIAAFTDRRWNLSALTDSLAEAAFDVLSTVPIADARRATRARTRAVPAPERTPAEPMSSRERLLAATEDLLSERGYSGTTIARICDRAEVDPGSVYWYFQDKNDLVDAVITRSHEEWVGRWELRESDGTASGVLSELRRALHDEILPILMQKPEYVRITHLLTLARTDQATQVEQHCLLLRHREERQLREWFVRNLPEGQIRDPRPTLLARFVLVLSDGVVTAAGLDDWEWDSAALVERLVASASHLLGPQPATDRPARAVSR